MKDMKTYKSWAEMRQRCNNKTHHVYHYYGGRGISICKRWDSFELFLLDMGNRPKGKTLDRIDVNGNYEPSNCRWASTMEQGANKRNNRIMFIDGVKMHMSEVARVYGLKVSTVHRRLKLGWSDEDAAKVSLNSVRKFNRMTDGATR